MTFFRVALLVLKKDFAIELKSYEILSTTLFFAVSCVAIFSFAFVKEGEAVVDAAAGILWIAIAFSGTLALGRTFERERYGETLKALLLAPAPRPAIYLGKLLGIVTLLFATEVIVVPMVAFLFNAPFFERPLLLVALLGLGTVGLCGRRDAVRGDAGAGPHARRHAADSAVPDYHTGDHRRRPRDIGAAGVAGRRTGGDAVDRAADLLRRGVRHALAVDV